MNNYIYWLEYCRYIFECIGYTDKDRPGCLVYLIHANLGDFRKDKGTNRNLGKLIFQKK